MKTLYLALPDLALQVELRRDPRLRGQPVVVGGLPHERRVVLAVSPEAARQGARPGMAPRQAQFVCPEAVFVAADEAGYARALEEVADALGRLSPLVEIDGIEGVWADARGLERLMGSDLALARRALEETRRATGLVARAGLGPWRLAAKLAARAARPERPLVLGGEEQALAFLRGLPLDWLPLSPESLERLELLGARRVGDFLRLPAAGLGRQVGPDAPRARALLLGEALEQPLARRAPRRLAARLALEAGVNAAAETKRLASLLAERLERLGLACRALALELEWRSGVRARRRASLREESADATLLGREFLRLLEQAGAEQAAEERAPQRLALEVEQLSRPRARQAGLFQAQRARREQALATIRRSSEFRISHSRGIRDSESGIRELPTPNPEDGEGWLKVRWPAMGLGPRLARADAGVRAPERPVGGRRFAAPRPLEVWVAPGGAPLRVRWWGRLERVRVCNRWRSGGAWWQGEAGRDYYRVLTGSRALLVLYRDAGNGRWYLEEVCD